MVILLLWSALLGCGERVLDYPCAAEAWRDQDGDGYGDPDFPQRRCETTVGYVFNDRDCDDTDWVITTECHDSGG